MGRYGRTEPTTQVRMSQSNAVALKKLATRDRRSLVDELDMIFVAGLNALGLAESVSDASAPR